ncbi:MAG: hypothetical protein COW30_07390, partial [Rhodospirillales bacterium CG15_BIG_FIL_POST_REV_8_21_14_020_66_15]
MSGFGTGPAIRDELQCDVLVVGGGVTGIAAATAAGRAGAKTILLETRPFVGGNGNTGLCLHNFISRLGKQAVFGLAQEIVNRLIPIGGAVGHVAYSGFVSAVTPVDGDLFRIVVTEMLDEAGVQIIYGALVIDTETDGAGTVTGLTVAMKGGLRTVRARAIVDASGDGDVAVQAGAPFRIGENNSGRMQPVSMLLHFIGVDTGQAAEALGDVPPAMAVKAGHPDPFPVYFDGSFRAWNEVVMEEGIFPNRDRNVFFNTVWPDRLNVNTSAVVDIDGTDPIAMSRATVDLTRQCGRIGEFMKRHVPGFANATYVPAAIVGVRESRNIQGLYEISDDDVKSGRKFDDTIGQICFPVDIHAPESGQATFDPIGDDGTFDIPYRAMVPKGLANLLVAGRCISASHYAHGATRNMAPCLVDGEAAGTAA